MRVIARHCGTAAGCEVFRCSGQSQRGYFYPRCSLEPRNVHEMFFFFYLSVTFSAGGWCDCLKDSKLQMEHLQAVEVGFNMEPERIFGGKRSGKRTLSNSNPQICLNFKIAGLLWTEEILHHLGQPKPFTNGITHLYQLAQDFVHPQNETEIDFGPGSGGFCKEGTEALPATLCACGGGCRRPSLWTCCPEKSGRRGQIGPP